MSKAGKAARAARNRRGAVMLEYILVCALLVLVGCCTVPVAMQLMRMAFEVVLAMVGSPTPSLF